MLGQLSLSADHLAQVFKQESKSAEAIRMYSLALAAEDKSTDLNRRKEISKRLIALKAEQKPPAKAARYNPNETNLSKMRLTKLPRLTAESGSAEFFLLFGPGPKLEGVKFISGSEKLKTAGKILSAGKFPVAFPEGSSAQLLRRGLAMCSAVTGCQIVLVPPQDVHSIE